MTHIPAPDRIDLAALTIVVGLLVAAYVIYPAQLLQVSVWFTIIMLFICWSGYFVYRLAFGEAQFWE
ncbi:hypothetical protein ACFQJ7_02910 [Halovenus rubra]|uniref:C4-dicarboxylate ABC transporter n=2 Tax=Halovenus rubra TaxID=869890 RepID=A0ABD5X178_9EURY|nr:hypothetical protein [Halovenus rubra]